MNRFDSGRPPRGRAVRATLCAALAAVLLVAVASPCQAKFFTPEKLLEYLDSGEPDKYNQAYGYIVGVYDSFEGVIYTHNHEVEEETLVHEVEKFMKSHRDRHYFSAQLSVLEALRDYRDRMDAEEKKAQP